MECLAECPVEDSLEPADQVVSLEPAAQVVRAMTKVQPLKRSTECFTPWFRLSFFGVCLSYLPVALST